MLLAPPVRTKVLEGWQQNKEHWWTLYHGVLVL